MENIVRKGEIACISLMRQNMVFCGKGLTGQVYQPVEKTLVTSIIFCFQKVFHPFPNDKS